MQKKSLETILYSSAGIIIMLVIVVAVNVIAGVRPLHMDLTQEKAYTLSDGTRAILKKLDTPVKIHFYCTQSETASPETVYLKNYARQVGDLLQEYKEIGGKNLIIEKYDPQPDSDAEDSAKLDGLEPRQLGSGDEFYLGLAISLADQTVAVPFLDPNRDRELEYDITRAVTRVLNPEKPVIGVMTALPVFGQMSNPMMMQMGQGGTPPWTIIEQLKQDYTVKQVEMTADKIDDDIKVLMVIYPKGISDETQYAIDQFVLRGGRLIAFLDPQSAIASRQQNPMSGEMEGASASLNKLLKAWGLQFDTSKVVADLNYKMELRGPNDQPQDAPAFLGLTSDAMNTNDVVTSQLGNVWLPMCGAFTGEPAPDLKETTLLSSSKESELVDGMMASMGGANIMTGFKPSGVNYKLGVRLTGKFKTAFPDGKPGEKTGTNEVAKAGEASLKESRTENSVVLFGDSDLLADEFSLRKMDGPFGVLVSEMNANLELAQNVVEEMAGDSSLIGIRSRATVDRPFTLVKTMEAEAEAQGEAKINELQQSLQDTEQRLSELQQQKQDKDQRLILSPEQKAEIENFRKQEASVSKELKQAQKDLRKQVVSLETRLTWLNILAMPLGVTAAGISIALIKRKKTSAK